MKKISQQGKVSFGQALKDFYGGYFDFRGTSTRSGFWWTILGISLAYAVLFVLTIVSSINRYYYHSPVNGFMLLVLLLFSMSLIIPLLALQTRRLRDVGLQSKTILTSYVLYFALYGTLFMSFYSSTFGAALSSLWLYGNYGGNSSLPLTSSPGGASLVWMFFYLLVAGVMLSSLFLPTAFLATKSQNAILKSIFKSK